MEVKTFDEFIEIDGMPCVRTRYEFTLEDRIHTPPPPIERRKIIKRRWWMDWNLPILRVRCERFANVTWLHVPSHLRELLRWDVCPPRRQPDEVEMFFAEKDRREFGDQRSLSEKLSPIHALSQ